MISENYACAYKEVIEILKYTKKEDVNKIPRYRILLWRKNMNNDHEFTVDPNKPLSEQNLSNEAKAIFANIFKKYWATDYQKQRISAKEKYDMQLEEEKKALKYNPDDIFKKHIQENMSEDNIVKEEVSIIEYKEPIFKRIINKIKSFFGII